MKVLAIKIEYDGTNYGGWQIQPNAMTVQERLQNALKTLTGADLSVIGAGRTDAGVHARGQVAHLAFQRYGMEKFPIPAENIAKAMNSLLPDDVQIRNAQILEAEFNARFDAIAREYSYCISTKESVFDRYFSLYFKHDLNWDILQKVASLFLGEHDFTTFSKDNPSTGSYVCDVQQSYWEKKEKNKLLFHIKANRFVYGMVRQLVGAMLDTARGKRSLTEIAEALEKKDRSLSSPMAAAKGLCLENVYYPIEFGLFT